MQYTDPQKYIKQTGHLKKGQKLDKQLQLVTIVIKMLNST